METTQHSHDVDENHEVWLAQILPQHERLAPIVQSLLEGMLQKEEIEYLSVTSRVKEHSEALKKIARKQYRDPQAELTDLSGIRVVTFLEAQVSAISKLIRTLFEIDQKNSLDRTAIIGLDRLGYRSTHFVCTLGKRRSSLPEYKALGGLKFEIQIRTVLQHAWAELAHDRSFKFAVALPTKIERKLNLYSGMLEIVDTAFDEISREIDAYKASFKHKSLRQISHAEIDSISLERFLTEISASWESPLKAGHMDIATEEVKQFGISTIGELQALASDQFLHKYQSKLDSDSGIGFIRLLMLYGDIDRYFQRVSPQWGTAPQAAFDFLLTKYGAAKLSGLLKKHKIEIRKQETSTPE
ncbi:hypothetical protein AOQ72_29850 [Bradyrhizobium yuanmingense]|uniref:RelA/SpoT domain-containing protein n=1 Tax=Bradyrhizobium yuanmingense TaxID=108015 RepID=A0A0R3C407_9BRAD|nr:hypothetical protein [Bradyrhizobium yuanmingense]KRP92375.1 hypothetical protein AOQ72_29850 [Bradyrhizobium yuanmingense]